MAAILPGNTWRAIWPPPHSVNTGVKKRPDSPLKFLEIQSSLSGLKKSTHFKIWVQGHGTPLYALQLRSMKNQNRSFIFSNLPPPNQFYQRCPLVLENLIKFTPNHAQSFIISPFYCISIFSCALQLRHNSVVLIKYFQIKTSSKYNSCYKLIV